ncbi:hypothetical protein Tco_0708045 [Tanacetum coccineum]
MLCKPKSFYDEVNRVAIGYKNPLYLSKAKQVQPALYNGHEIVKTNHARALVYDSEDTLEIAETNRKQMLEKNERPRAKALKEKAKSTKPITAMTKVKITPHDYSKENYLGLSLPPEIIDHWQSIVVVELLKINLTQKIQKDDHDEMIKHFSKLEVEHLNLQLKYQHLKERFGNKKSVTSSDAPAFESVFEIGNLKEQLQGRGNTIRELKEKISRLQKKHSEADPILDFKALDSQNKDLNAKVNALQDLNERFRVENEKVKQHYKELYDSIKLTRAKTIEKTTSLLTEIETLKAQIKGKTKCVTMPDPVKPKVLAPGMYAIDVEPIPPRNRNNREVHLEYLKHLKESVGTLREIVEEARVEKPLDSSLASACLYTKHSQELLEYVIGTCETSTNNSQTHVEQQTPKKTNERMIPSTRVKDAIAASGSKPRSNTKKDRTLPAKSDKKKVEDHSRNNKSSVKQKNRVDSSISYKRTVINLNSNPVCKECNKCLMSFNHGRCVVKSLKFVKKPPVNKPTRRKFTLGEQCPLTRFTESKVVLVKQPKSVSTSDIVITERLSNTSQKSLTRTPTEVGDPTNFVKKFIGTVRFGNGYFGVIMGYGDYVIGDSVISRVYYVEGLGHNLFSIRQFCNSDLEVAFRKHSCYVRDVNGVDLIKGNRGTNC